MQRNSLKLRRMVKYQRSVLITSYIGRCIIVNGALSLHRRQSLTFVLFLFQIREIGLAGSRIGGHNRGESVVEGADLKPLSPGENLWSDYGIFSPCGFAFVVLFSLSFFTNPRSGGRPSPGQRGICLCRA